MAKKEFKKKHKISEVKIRKAKELASLMDSKKSLVVASTLNLLSSQLQEIRKKLREKAEIKFAKKSTILRALDQSKKENIKDLSKYLLENDALIFSEEDPFDIAEILSENKYPAKAKAGQIAKEDIAIEKGPTDLMPGPILTELGNVGLKAGIVGGKVTIKERKVLLKKGEKISRAVADILMKLEISPFKVELEPLAAYDSSSKKIYNNIKIDKEETLAKLKELFSSALQFAINIGYPTKESINQILINAEKEAIALNNLVSQNSPNQENKENNSIENISNANVQQNKEEN